MKYKLFDFQEKCLEDCYNYIMNGDIEPGLVICPVGWGKTLAIASLGTRLAGGVLVLTLSQELLSQNLEKFESFGGQATVYSAALDSKEVSSTTFATLKSVKQAVEELKKFKIKYVIIDECDRNFSPKKGSEFMKFITALKPKSVIGFTATPWALEAGRVGSQLTMLNKLKPPYFKRFIHVTQISELVAKGRWSKCEYEIYDFDNSLLKLNSSLSDYTAESILEANRVQGVNRNMAVRLKKLIADGYSRILVFVDSTENSEIFANWLPDSAVLTSNTPAKDRKRIVRDFKAGIIKVLFNYGVLSIGFDYPELEVVMVGRSSNSLSWIYQIFGRGVRVHENKKSFRFIDYGGNIQRFGKIEDLEIKLLPAAGYTVVNKNRVLTGVPLGTNYSVDQYVDLVRFGPKKEVLDFKIRFWFGKHKDKPLIQVPLHYLKWWAQNSDEYTRSAKERELFNEIAKVLRMKVLVK